MDATIGDYLRDLNDGYRIEKILYDPYQLHDLSTRLRAEGIPMEEYPHSVTNLMSMSQNFFGLIQTGNILFYPAEDVRA